MTIKRVLITGAYGLIGNLVYTQLAAQPDAYLPSGLVRHNSASERAVAVPLQRIPDAQLHIADLTDFAAVQRAVEGVDVVVHLAADPSGHTGWESVLNSNIIGTQHVFEASRLAGVKRVIFASTNQVVFGYREDEPYRTLLAGAYDAIDLATYRPVAPQLPTRPLNFYSSSKVFGEALAHMYAYSHGMSCIALRIGWVTGNDQLPQHSSGRALWCSHRDIVQVIERCINAPESLRFDTFFAQSDNRYNLVDISHTKDVLGYQPQDSAEERLGK